MNLTELSSTLPGVLIWKKNLNGIYQEVNQLTAQAFGYTHPEKMIGAKDENTPCKMSEFHEVFQREDQNVIATKKTRKFIEVMCCAKNEWKIFIVTKNPNNDSGKITGTFSFCVDATSMLSHFLPAFIAGQYHDTETLQKSFALDSEYGNLKLSKMQSLCLFHLLRGKTYKQIAHIAKISPRSVETHVEYLKIKFNCRHKSDLIEKAIYLGYDSYIPAFIHQKQFSMLIS